LEYLGNTAGLTVKHSFVRRAVEWLLKAQEQDGSWYGRWGICYIYGAWAALTGMLAVGQSRTDPAIVKAVAWLARIQNPDGGWGESCESDRLKRYVPLTYSTSSQTAWALDALVAYHDKPTRAMERAADFLLLAIHRSDRSSQYPTGAGLPGQFYFYYHSYPYIWPLLALSHYQTKYRPYG
jgi:sporulenol synthase